MHSRSIQRANTAAPVVQDTSFAPLAQLETATVMLTTAAVNTALAGQANSNQSLQKSTQPPTAAVSGSGGLQLGGGMSLGAGLGLGNAMPVIATPVLAPTVTAPATPAPVSNMRDAVTIPVKVKHSICFDKTEGDKSGQMRI